MPFQFTGSYTPDDEMNGQLNESGFENFPMTLTREIPAPAATLPAATTVPPAAPPSDAVGAGGKVLPHLLRRKR